MNPPSVGSDIGAMCGKCKRETWHVVLAMVDGTIARVQCKLCDAQHRFRPPPGAAGSGSGRTRKSSAKAGDGPGDAQAGAGRAREPEGPTVEADLSRPARAYRADQVFQIADRVEHPTFGSGVVELSEPGKITVYFTSGRKILAQARAEAQLQRRRPSFVEPEADEASEAEGAGQDERPAFPHP